MTDRQMAGVSMGDPSQAPSPLQQGRVRTASKRHLGHGTAGTSLGGSSQEWGHCGVCPLTELGGAHRQGGKEARREASEDLG